MTRGSGTRQGVAKCCAACCKTLGNIAEAHRYTVARRVGGHGTIIITKKNKHALTAYQNTYVYYDKGNIFGPHELKLMYLIIRV